MQSSADWTKPSKSFHLQDASKHWSTYAPQNSLKPIIISHLAQGRDSHPLTEQQRWEVVEIAHTCSHRNCSDPACVQMDASTEKSTTIATAVAAKSRRRLGGSLQGNSARCKNPLAAGLSIRQHQSLQGPRKSQPPTALDVQRTFEHMDAFGQYIRISLDFKQGIELSKYIHKKMAASSSR